MSIWVFGWQVSIYQQPDNTFAAMASRDGMKGWFSGNGATPDQALEDVKKYIYRSYPSYQGYENKFVVIGTVTKEPVAVDSVLNERERISRMILERIREIEIKLDDCTYFSDDWWEWNSCLKECKRLLSKI